MTIRFSLPLILLITLGVACDDNDVAAAASGSEALTAVHRRLDLRNVPGRHVAAWDAMFALDEETSRRLLADHITEDCFITFKLPAEFGGDQSFEPGINGWMNVVMGSARSGGWVPAGPGYPRSLHLSGSINVLQETSTTARLRTYIRATHYAEDTTTDFSEAIVEMDVIFDDERDTWLVAHLDLSPLSLREEGGAVLPPVTAPPGSM